MRIGVLNNYSLSFDWERVQTGRLPDHYLYGLNHLVEWGCEVELIEPPPRGGWRLLQRLLDRQPLPVGQLQTQFAAWRRRSRLDVIYAPCQTELFLLGYLRAFRVGRPVVALMHHPLARGRLARLRRPFWRLFLRGAAAVPSLSAGVRDEVNRLAGRDDLSVVLPWGPDTAYYPPADYPGEGFIAAGFTGRDNRTFARAVRLAGVPATIYCRDDAVAWFADERPPHLRVVTAPVHVEHHEVMQALRACRAVAIPMARQSGLCGLSGLLDVLGLGKPVVMTRNPLIDLDIEKAGIGFWVEPGDVEGWRVALTRLQRDPELATAMGRAARNLALNGLDSRQFSRRLFDLLRRAREGGRV